MRKERVSSQDPVRLDRHSDIKLPLYARPGIPEVWLVDIENAQLTLHSEPGAAGYARIESRHHIGCGSGATERRT